MYIFGLRRFDWLDFLMRLSARHHYFRVLLLLFQPPYTHERRTNCFSQLFDELGHFVRIRARRVAGARRRHLVENSAPRHRQILKWRNWIGFSRGTFSRSACLFAPRTLYWKETFIFPFRPRALRTNPTVLPKSDVVSNFRPASVKRPGWCLVSLSKAWNLQSFAWKGKVCRKSKRAEPDSSACAAQNLVITSVQHGPLCLETFAQRPGRQIIRPLAKCSTLCGDFSLIGPFASSLCARPRLFFSLGAAAACDTTQPLVSLALGFHPSACCILVFRRSDVHRDKTVRAPVRICRGWIYGAWEPDKKGAVVRSNEPHSDSKRRPTAVQSNNAREGKWWAAAQEEWSRKTLERARDEDCPSFCNCTA